MKKEAILFGVGLVFAAVVLSFIGPAQHSIKGNFIPFFLRVLSAKIRYIDGLTDETLGHSVQAEAYARFLRLFIRNSSPLSEHYLEVRQKMKGIEEMLPPRDDIKIEDNTFHSDEGHSLHFLSITPPLVDPHRTILYLHGGGYYTGTSRAVAAFVGELARRSRARAFAVDYRLAPEHVMPTGIRDCVAAYNYLVHTRGIPPEQIVLAGDSAGGGATLLTLLAIREQKLGTPAGAIAISPWVDLATDRPSNLRNEAHDALLLTPMVELAMLATGTKTNEGEKRRDPKISPIYADWRGGGVPPVLIFVGEWEKLTDDSVDLAKEMKQAGVSVTLVIGKHMQHDYVLFPDYFPEGLSALDEASEFVRTRTK